MTKVYLVTHGNYSDYGVLGVYSTPERAEKAKEAFMANNDIVEFDLDAFAPQFAERLPCAVQMSPTGDVEDCFRTSLSGFTPRWRLGGYCSRDRRFIFYMWARDEQHAVKIANEWRAQLVALGREDPRDIDLMEPDKFDRFKEFQAVGQEQPNVAADTYLEGE